MANETNLKYELMNLKYELTNNLQVLFPSTKILYQIRALKDFGNVKKGDLGGWIESEDNLSQEGNCWIYDNAKVYGNAVISGNAKVYDDAIVRGNSTVTHHSVIINNAKITNSIIIGNVLVRDGANIAASIITGNAIIGGNCNIFDSKIQDNVIISGDLLISRGTQVCDNAEIYGSGMIRNSHIYALGNIKGFDFCISNGDIKNNKDFISFSAEIVHDGKFRISDVTIYRSQNGDVIIKIRHHSPNPSMSRRIVAEYKNTVYAFKEDLRLNNLLSEKGRSLVYDAISYIEGC